MGTVDSDHDEESRYRYAYIDPHIYIHTCSQAYTDGMPFSYDACIMTMSV